MGEPINPEAWTWYHEHIGGNRCPIVDTWWQTETGQILLTPLPGLTTTKPGSATLPFPGIEAMILTEDGTPVEVGGGFLAIRGGWPGRTLGIWGDEQRFIDTYWSKWDRNTYFPGDGAKRDADGYFWILGRVDDVLNVSGHRIGTMEVESALVDHPAVAEAAVVGAPDELKGQAIAAFVTLREGRGGRRREAREIRDHVAEKIGAIARPEEVLFAADLPKTRSGKIMRRLLRDIAEGRALGDTTTLADPARALAHGARHEAEGSRRHDQVGAPGLAGGAGAVPQAGLDRLGAGDEPLPECRRATGRRQSAGLGIDRASDEPRRLVAGRALPAGPAVLDHVDPDRQSTAGAGQPGARAVVVADPDQGQAARRVSDEPGVPGVVGRAGLAGGRLTETQPRGRACRPLLEHALEHVVHQPRRLRTQGRLTFGFPSRRDRCAVRIEHGPHQPGFACTAPPGQTP